MGAEPRIVGDYELQAELGRGGMGRVFRARERATGALRAVKVLEGLVDPESVERFRRETQALARLGGAGVVAIHQAGEAHGRLFFAMDLMPGGSLDERLKRSGTLPWREAVALVAKVARTLGACAAAGLVHRDVKPANILFDEQGEPRVADFGLVRDLTASRLTETGTLIGTPAYMAPEQLDGRPADARADVFALGAILHELLTGRRPFEATAPLPLLAAIAKGPPPPLAAKVGAPDALDALLAHALALDPARRPADGGALADALDALLAAKGEKTTRAPLVLLALVAASAVGGLVALLAARQPPAGGDGVASVASPSSPPLPTPSPKPDDAEARARELAALLEKIRAGNDVVHSLEAAAALASSSRADIRPHVAAASARLDALLKKLAQGSRAGIGMRADKDWRIETRPVFAETVLLHDALHAIEGERKPPEELISQAMAFWATENDHAPVDRDQLRALVVTSELLEGANAGCTRAAANAIMSFRDRHVSVADARAFAARLARTSRGFWPLAARGKTLIAADPGTPARSEEGWEALRHAIDELASMTDARPGPNAVYFAHHLLAVARLEKGDDAAREELYKVDIDRIAPDAACYALIAYLAVNREKAIELLENGAADLARDDKLDPRHLANVTRFLERARLAATDAAWEECRRELREASRP